MPTPPTLVVNADDFGYFPEVSRGIATCIKDGIVTATSLLVTRETTADDVATLCRVQGADHGVHLNVSHGTAVTDELHDALGGEPMPDKFALLAALASGRVKPEQIGAEWYAQLARARDGGLGITFVNCHEHLHMFPGLFSRFLQLTETFSIPYIRYCTPEWTSVGATGGRLLRSGLFALTNLASRRPLTPVSGMLIGTAPSGALNADYLETVLPRLKPGKLYELMCHPGTGVPENAGDLTGYHAWDAERELLCDPATRELINRHGVRLARYTEFTG